MVVKKQVSLRRPIPTNFLLSCFGEKRKGRERAVAI
jgi:hypothetical protein